MAKTMYRGVSGVARKVKQPYQGVGGVARKVKNGYVGVGGVARQFYSGSVTLGSLPVGTTVKTTYGGVSTEFIVVHHGTPSSDYSNFENGTCLWLKYALPITLTGETVSLGTTWLDLYDYAAEDYYQVCVVDYSSGGSHGRLNNYVVKQLGVSSLIRSVTIPYDKPQAHLQYDEESDSDIEVVGHRKAYLKDCKLFLLSLNEMGITSQSTSAGVKLDYFIDSGVYSNNTEANNLRKFQYSADSSTYKEYWTRTILGETTAFFIGDTGYRGVHDVLDQVSFLTRFAFVLPSTTLVDDSYNIIV